MKKTIFVTACILAVTGSCFTEETFAESETIQIFPEVLSDKTFIYDELKNGEGSSLFTLTFTDKGYKLYQDNGKGIIAEGEVLVFSDKTMMFSEGKDEFFGEYSGSAFQAPSVTIEYDGKTMEFQPDTESGEYVYLSYLGVFEGETREGKEAVLILERWFEFYLYIDDRLIRGTYEIYDDGTILLSTDEKEVLDGEVLRLNSTETDENEIFDIQDINIHVDFNSSELASESIVFEYAMGNSSYEAEHAMGTYRLTFYDGDVFTIHGVDGFIKAMGSTEVNGDNGKAIYFPRDITNEIETQENITVEYQIEEDGMIFPSSTYLLPRSGNVDEETGYGSYWTAGTILEFVKHTEWSEEEYIQYESSETEKDAPLKIAFNNESGILRQSMPSLNEAKPLVLMIEFPDYNRPRFITPEGIEEALFDVENKDSLSAYYYRSSYGKLLIDGTVLDWYCMEKERDQYDSDKDIMKEVLDYYINQEGLDLSEYDADGNGEIDSLYVLWAGNMDDSNHMWSSAYRSTWLNSPEEWNTKVSGYIFVPGSTVWSSVPPLVCNVNSLTHETGHLLGLNDYYSYDTTDRNDDESAYTGGAMEGGLGGMDMMDANIAEHNAFSKWLLGWLEPEVVEYEDISSLKEQEKVYTLHPVNEQGDAIFVKLKPSDSLFTELLVIEVVSSTMNAKDLTRLKTPVVRILHVNAELNEDSMEGNWRSYGFKNDNSYTSTKFISLVEADGEDEVLNYMPGLTGEKLSYDIADYYVAGDIVTPSTYPNTNSYDAFGNATVFSGLTISVESISEDGEAVIRLGYEDKEETLSLINVSPEQTIVPYKTGSQNKINPDTKEIIFSFDKDIIVDEENESLINVYSGNQKMEGYVIDIDGNELAVKFEKELERNNDYTVMIPQGIIKSSEDEKVINNFNTVMGFITE